jgi:hypothetical protein
MFGNYKKAMLLFTGPILFYFMLTSTVPGNPTLIKYGQRLMPQSELTEKMEQFLPSTEDPNQPRDFRISWFFSLYDNLISSVMQNAVSVLVDTENKQDIVNLARERIYSQIFMVKGVDQPFVEIASLGTLGYCGDVSRRELELSNSRLKNAADGTPEKAEADQLKQEIQRLRAEERINITAEERNYLSHLDPSEVSDFLEGTSVNTSQSDWQELVNKKVHSCNDTWQFVTLASILEAKRAVGDLMNNCGDDTQNTNGVPWSKVCQDVLFSIAGEENEADANRVGHQVVAAYLLKNALQNTAHTALMTQVNSHAPFNEDRNQFDTLYGEILNAEGQGMLAGLTYFRGVVPFVQGLLLFLLAASFPFFTVLLVIPGRIESFATWMTLWLWVKSWDVGFALIQAVRDMLWQYLGHSIKDDGAVLNWSDPAVLFQQLSQHDPLANVNTYYLLVNLMTLSVPMVTAHMCMGATDVFEAFKTSLNTTADRFGSARTQEIRNQSKMHYDKLIDKEANEHALKTVNDYIRAQGGDTAKLGQFKSAGDFLSWAGRGDKTQSNDLATLYRASIANYHLSDRADFLASKRAMADGRRMSYNNGRSKDLLTRDLFQYNDANHAGRMAGRGSNIPIVGSPNSGWNEQDPTTYFSSGGTGGDAPAGDDAIDSSDAGGGD